MAMGTTMIRNIGVLYAMTMMVLITPIELLNSEMTLKPSMLSTNQKRIINYQ